MRSDQELARLLSGRDEWSILEKEEVLERVLQNVAPPATRPKWMGLSYLALAAGSALIVGTGLHYRDEFRARGHTNDEPIVNVVCAETGKMGTCHTGGTLAFDVRATPADRYLSVFARAVDGTVTWLLPEATAKSVPVDDSASLHLLNVGARVDSTLPPGRYEIVAVFSAEPLDRPSVKSRLGEDLSGGTGLRVIKSRLVVEASP